MFEQTFLERDGSARRPWPVAFSFAAQAAFTGVIVLVPLLNTAKIAWQPTPVILYAPPLPAPPVVVQRSAPLRAVATQSLRQVFRAVFTAPRHIPVSISTLPDPMPAPDLPWSGTAGTANAIQFGPPAIGAESKNAAQSVSSARSAPKPSAIRVGTGVQSAKLLAQPKPAYPPLAKAARISGVVRLQALIGRDGTIRNLQLIGGPPLLVAAALDAVRRWTYQPTLLNGEPVEVFTEIEVHFTLNQ